MAAPAWLEPPVPSTTAGASAVSLGAGSVVGSGAATAIGAGSAVGATAGAGAATGTGAAVGAGAATGAGAAVGAAAGLGATGATGAAGVLGASAGDAAGAIGRVTDGGDWTAGIVAAVGAGDELTATGIGAGPSASEPRPHALRTTTAIKRREKIAATRMRFITRMDLRHLNHARGRSFDSASSWPSLTVVSGICWRLRHI